jgi:hypothetical protein
VLIIYVRLIFILNLLNCQLFIVLFLEIIMDRFYCLCNFGIILFFVTVFMSEMGFRLTDVF